MALPKTNYESQNQDPDLRLEQAEDVVESVSMISLSPRKTVEEYILDE